MNILYLAHRIPYPPDKGDKLRSFRQLEHLARHHRVWCACFVDTPSDVQYTELLAAYCQDVAAIPLNRTWATLRGLTGLLRGRTLTEAFYRDSVLKAAIDKWIGSVNFDVVVAFSSSMAQYALQVPAGRHVLDLCDLDSRKWLDYAEVSAWPGSWLYRVEGTRLARREDAWLASFDASIVITEAEACPIKPGVGAGRVHIVGNGVTLPTRPPGQINTIQREGLSGPNEKADVEVAEAAPPTVGFVGVMNYKPNVDAVRWFVRNCWKQIRAACPGAVFRIVGHTPTRRVRELGRVPGVEVVGSVEDVMAEVECFDVSVAPMQVARGLQNKVLEAMAAARPVVLSSRAANGIGASDGDEYIIADTPEDVNAGVILLLNDPATHRRIGQAARQFVATHHCWTGELQKFELIVTGALPPATRPRRTLQPATNAPEERLLRASIP